jgi:CHAT domain-containing protein
MMSRFYRLMLEENQTPVEALRAAQLEMQQQQEWQSPYFWSGFV